MNSNSQKTENPGESMTTASEKRSTFATKLIIRLQSEKMARLVAENI